MIVNDFSCSDPVVARKKGDLPAHHVQFALASGDQQEPARMWFESAWPRSTGAIRQINLSRAANRTRCIDMIDRLHAAIHSVPTQHPIACAIFQPPATDGSIGEIAEKSDGATHT